MGLKNGDECPFVKVVEKLNRCPCSDVPKIETGPPCPFLEPPRSQSSCPLNTLLKPNGGCPLAKPKPQPRPKIQSKSCLFSQPKRIRFETYPAHRCSCAPGTCPELAKNAIRAMGLDPMCGCECPETLNRKKVQAASSEVKIFEGKSPYKGRPLKEMASENASMRIGADPVQSDSNKEPARNKEPTDSADLTTYADPVKAEYSDKTSDPGKHRDPIKNLAPADGSGLILEGIGFKIFNVGGEKVLYNYSPKNCQFIGCGHCNEEKPSDMGCGCDEWMRKTMYRNCCCPGARNSKPRKKSAIVDKREKPVVDTQLANGKEIHAKF